jgi:hypothetical protein
VQERWATRRKKKEPGSRTELQDRAEIRIENFSEGTVGGLDEIEDGDLGGESSGASGVSIAQQKRSSFSASWDCGLKLDF